MQETILQENKLKNQNRESEEMKMRFTKTQVLDIFDSYFAINDIDGLILFLEKFNKGEFIMVQDEQEDKINCDCQASTN